MNKSTIIDNVSSAAEAWRRLKEVYDFDYAMAHIMAPAPVNTGVPKLDHTLGGGIPAGTYTAIAGEGGSGKSALACVIAYEAALSGLFPVFFSMEMPAEMVIGRLLSIHTSRIRELQAARGVPESEWMRQTWWSTSHNLVRKIAGHRIATEEEAELYRAEHPDDPVLVAWEDFRETIWPYVLVVANIYSIQDACELVRGLYARGIRTLPIVDYLQLGADGDDAEASVREYERISKASVELARLAKDCQIPLVAVSSLRKMGREERKEAPTLQMLHGSGRIGFDCGTAIIIKRDAERDGAEQPIEAHVVKNRVGPSGTSCKLMFNGGLNMFR
ncbi:MAG: hypothetical protein IKG21_12890 [Atopobiaceae bacterium]|nr:hypothetical protein [Atopobiaceae bacterium]